MMNIAICNGDAQCSRQIENVIKSINAEFGDKFDFRTFPDARSLSNSEWHFDIAILGIGKVDGIRLAQSLQKADSHLITLFVTSHSEHLDSAFEIGAFRFLSKPLDTERLTDSLLRAYDKIKNSSDYIYIKNGSTYVKVYFDDILYIEIQNRKTTITTVHSCLTSQYNMAYWRRLLAERDFETPHNSFLVNLKHITLYKKRQCVVLNNSYIIDISRTKSISFDNGYTEYLKTKNKIA